MNDSTDSTSPLSIITEVNLQNWRNLKDVQIGLRPANYLIGPNAAGKSNFLDAIYFCRDCATIGIEQAVRNRGGMREIRSLHSHRHNEVAIGLTFRSRNDRAWSYFLSITGKDEVEVVAETASCDGDLLLNRGRNTSNDREAAGQTFLQQMGMNKDFRPITNFLRSVAYLHPVPQLMRHAGKATMVSDDPYGSDLIERIASVPSKRRDVRLARISESLKEAIPGLRGIEVQEDARDGRHNLSFRFANWRPRGTYQDESSMSDGTLRLVGLLWALQEKGGPLLLEEPEQSLHPELVMRLPLLFARMQREFSRQLVISTHSPYMFCNGVEPDEVLVFRPSEGGSKITHASRDLELMRQVEAGRPLSEALADRSGPHLSRVSTLFEFMG